MVRSVTTFGEDFTDEDMAAALDWQAERASRCRCGFPSDESMAEGRDEAYTAELWICHACAAGERAEESHRRDGGSMAGIRTRTTEVELLTD